MYTEIISYLNSHKKDLYTLLEELVCIQSGSRNKSGVDRVGARIRQEMESMGFACTTVPQEDLGNHLIARNSCSAEAKPVLITGHMDTVFPEDTDFTTYWEDDKHCYGPGTADMKGGLVVGIFALKALAHAGLPADLPIVFVFNSDEEIGSPTSRDLILDLANQSAMAFVLEAGGLSGEIVTGRKGNFSARVTVEGRAGHAAFAGKDKASAILELARKTIEIEALNQPDKGISANVGTFQGGIGPNTIAQHASAALDFRFLQDSDKDDLLARLERIVAHTTTLNTRSDLAIVSQRPAMPQTPANQALFEKILETGKAIDVPVKPELRQGVSDANIIARAGIPVIDGLGPIGAKDHSHDEYIEKQSLLDRTLLFAHVLAGIPEAVSK